MRDIDITAPPAALEPVSDHDPFDPLPEALPPWETGLGMVPAEAPEAVPTTPPSQPRRSSSRRATDDQIYAALRAGEAEGASAAALCETYGITLPTYCVWKRKYGSLTFEELRAARRGETRRRRTLAAALAGGAIVCAASLWLFVMPARSPDPVVTAPARSAAAVNGERRARTPARAQTGAQPPAQTADVQPTSQIAARVAAPAPGPPPPATRAGTNGRPQPQATKPPPRGVPPLASDDSGIVIQVMAAPTWGEAKAALDSLRTAGHRAYALAATVGDVPVYRVRVGPFDTRQAAGRAIRDLERDGYGQPWIVR